MGFSIFPWFALLISLEINNPKPYLNAQKDNIFLEEIPLKSVQHILIKKIMPFSMFRSYNSYINKKIISDSQPSIIVIQNTRMFIPDQDAFILNKKFLCGNEKKKKVLRWKKQAIDLIKRGQKVSNFGKFKKKGENEDLFRIECYAIVNTNFIV